MYRISFIISFNKLFNCPNYDEMQRLKLIIKYRITSDMKGDFYWSEFFMLHAEIVVFIYTGVITDKEITISWVEFHLLSSVHKPYYKVLMVL